MKYPLIIGKQRRESFDSNFDSSVGSPIPSQSFYIVNTEQFGYVVNTNKNLLIINPLNHDEVCASYHPEIELPNQWNFVSQQAI